MKKTKEMCICALFTALMCAGVFIKIPAPIPITLQTLFTCLAGLLLGSKKGSLSVAVYVFLGLIGLPVFAEGGGIYYVLKPSFGYIIGFWIATFVTGKIAEKKVNFKTYILASFVGMFIIYAIGIVYYYMISSLYLGEQLEMKTLLLYGFLLTLPGDILMCILSSTIGIKLKKILKI